MKYWFFIITCLTCTSCYRMPEEGEVRTIPMTNNPTMTRQQNSWQPGIDQ